MSGTAAWVHSSVPVRLTASIWFHSAASVFKKGALLAWPALFTRMEIGPKRWRALTNAAFTCSGSDTSALTACRRSGCSAARACTVASLRPKTVTFAPCATSRRAIAAPIPWPPPVTKAWRFCKAFDAAIVVMPQLPERATGRLQPALFRAGSWLPSAPCPRRIV